MAASGKKVAFLLTKGVEQVELTSPREALDGAGATTVIVSPESPTLQAMQGDWEHGDVFDVDLSVADANPADYDALVLPGGTLNADSLRLDEDAVAFVKEYVASGRPVAAICHAPWILVQAGVASGRRLTSYASLEHDLRNAGAEWVDEEVVVDGNLITSRNPGDLDAFNGALLEALGE
ncbi:type 1 glutamine amidotransferase domain-containing protein [Microbacterium oryzae]|uniref:type 1 glutamine amidotransferase domain-containing protein n=1 Tax=Microbacterium oryzae TaxID=743009 RepID=UPI0025B236A4|nr:type 1 glutamine amidotransferase domain-containing protein [Microbacterium oryzae]MDN3310703.1 type 1 glutamine amidotransferase domain-containing protein [Microbacterium oryzae]